MADKKYLGLDTSTWITIGSQILGLVFMFGVFYNQVSNHTHQIKRLDEIATQNTQKLIAHEQTIDALIIRANKLDNAVTDIGVLKNDMDWLKRFLLAKEAKEDSSNNKK